MSRPFLGATILFLSMLAAAKPVSAHALGAECKIRKDRVELEAYFSDDTPAQGAKVSVEDSAKIVMIEGKTDTYGKWSFPVPKPGDYNVIVDAGDGHHVERSLIVPVSPTDAPTQSTGPSRSEFTRTPWLRVGIGLTCIALVSMGARRIARQTRPAR
jgi:hypothetical protein